MLTKKEIEQYVENGKLLYELARRIATQEGRQLLPHPIGIILDPDTHGEVRLERHVLRLRTNNDFVDVILTHDEFINQGHWQREIKIREKVRELKN